MATHRKYRPRKKMHVHHSIFAGNARVLSTGREEQVPLLRSQQFLLSPRADKHEAYERIYVSDRYAGIETWHWVVLEEVGRIKKVCLCHKEGRYVFVKCDYRAHRMTLSIVYSGRKEAMIEYERSCIRWHRRLDGV